MTWQRSLKNFMILLAYQEWALWTCLNPLLVARQAETLGE